MSEDPGCGVSSKPTKRELRELRLMVDNYREGYQKALNDMLQRLDRLMENSEDMDWHRGVMAARHELCHLPIPPASPGEVK